MRSTTRFRLETCGAVSGVRVKTACIPSPLARLAFEGGMRAGYLEVAARSGMNTLAASLAQDDQDAGGAQLHTPKKPTPPGPPAAGNVLRNGYHGRCTASGFVDIKWRGLENGDAFAERAEQLVEFAVMQPCSAAS